MTHRASCLCLPPLIGVAILLAACQGPGLPPAPPPDLVSDDPAGEQPHMTPETPGGQPEATPGTLAGGVPTLTTFDAHAGEADGLLRFKVAFSGSAIAPVTVSYATEDRTTTAGADYQPASGVLTFAPEAAAAQWIDVPITDDNVAEDAEILMLRLSDPANAELAVTTATATIVDNDRRAIIVDPGALNIAEGGAAHYTVMLGSQPTGPVTVIPTPASAELTLTPAALRFTAGDWRAAKTVTVTATQDDDALADAAVQLAHEVRGGGYDGVPGVPVAVTIVEADVSTLALAPAHASEAAGTMRFAVTLSLAHDADVTVDYATGADSDTAVEGHDYTRTTGTLSFPARSTAAQTISVAIRDDEQDEDDEWFTVTLRNPTHATLAGGAATLAATGRIDDDDSPSRVAVADASLTEGGGALRFNVSLVPASGRTVTVHYATADGTAVAGSDYTAVTGTLTFSTAVTVRTISVPVLDDQDHEHTETFTVTLSVPVNATLSSTGWTATGTIDDNDLPPRISIDDATLTEGSNDEPMHFTVSLDRAAGGAVTVDYATADDTAAAGSDYTTASGTLTIPSGSTAQTISVTIVADSAHEQTETFTVTLSNPTGATLSDATATGTIVDPASLALELSTLQVTGGSSATYPEFSPDTLHYALTCNNSTTLDVTAQALRTTAQLTLLRADTAQNVVATGTLATAITVDQDDDIAIELSDAGDTVTYVVHCLPAAFPAIDILARGSEVSDGLLLVTPRLNADTYLAIIDNNGVPWFHRHANHARNLRRQADGRYSYHLGHNVRIFDAQLQNVTALSPQPPFTDTDPHDFLITDEGNYLFLDLLSATRNACDFRSCDPGTDTMMITVRDSWIQEVTPEGDKVFEWNSGDHLKLSDCKLGMQSNDYAHINSLYLADGDIIASFRHCNTVVRIDRSGGTGRLVWQVGGTSPPRDAATDYLAVVDDTTGENEFCGQHSAILSESGTLLLFDNGNLCNGPRKRRSQFSRVVEYELVITDTQKEAVFQRQYLLPSGNGSVYTRGSVIELANGNWLIAWGQLMSASLPYNRRLSISEVDPDVEPSGVSLLDISFYSRSAEKGMFTYRVYREDETTVDIPLSLP